MILIILFGLIIAAFAVYHAVKYIKGSKKHRIRFVNIVLVAVAVVSAVLIFIDQQAIDSKRGKYRVSSGTLLSSLNYDKQVSDYYTFDSTALFSYSREAVKKSDAKLPWISKIYSPVAIYQSKDAKTGFDTIEVNGQYYELYDKVVKIVPDYFMLLFFCILISAGVLILFNIAVVIAYVKNKTPKERTD